MYTLIKIRSDFLSVV